MCKSFTKGTHNVVAILRDEGRRFHRTGRRQMRDFYMSVAHARDVEIKPMTYSISEFNLTSHLRPVVN